MLLQGEVELTAVATTLREVKASRTERVRMAMPASRAANSVSSAGDSVGAVPGSADAMFVYRFRQTEPASSGTFSYRDRDLSFSFRPSPNALYFGVENLQGRPVPIDVFEPEDEVARRAGHREDVGPVTAQPLDHDHEPGLHVVAAGPVQALAFLAHRPPRDRG